MCYLFDISIELSKSMLPIMGCHIHIYIYIYAVSWNKINYTHIHTHFVPIYILFISISEDKFKKYQIESKELNDFILYTNANNVIAQNRHQHVFFFLIASSFNYLLHSDICKPGPPIVVTFVWK